MRSVISFVLAILLFFAAPADSKSDPLKSIRPLQLMQKNEIGDDYLDDLCTTWATRISDTPVWVTASHCITVKDGMPDLSLNYFIDGKPAVLRRVDFDHDVAVLMGGPIATPLPISQQPPRQGQKVWSAGYPMSEGRTFAIGVVMNLETSVHHLMLFELPGAPGVSGAPVLNEDNAVVGIVQAMACPYLVGYCPAILGLPYDQMREALNFTLTR